jgi:hypothetical protein
MSSAVPFQDDSHQNNRCENYTEGEVNRAEANQESTENGIVFWIVLGAICIVSYSSVMHCASSRPLGKI